MTDDPMTPPTPDTPTPDTPRRASRGFRILLFVSLAMNMLIVGLLVGALSSGRMGSKPRVDFDFGPFFRSLSEEDRRAIVQSVRSNPDIRPPSPRNRRQDLLTFVDIMRSDPFDSAAMADLMAKQRENGSRVLVAAHGAFLERMEASSLEDRIAFADRLVAELRDRRPGGNGQRNGNSGDRSNGPSSSGD